MSRKRTWILVFLAVAVVGPLALFGCGRKEEDKGQGVGQQGGKALQWKKSKEKELSGEDADKGE